jgi:modified peptide precursor CbpA
MKRPKEKIKADKKEAAKKDIIAHRKACDARGTGLSHYIFSGKKTK